ncbi:MAG TPA: diacylglycerol kinase family protein [Gaiellaceae bacterium]|nr:diacylglycerol kinase family protein [Gaiellaceae bacterium]
MAQAVLIVNPYASRVTDELVDRVVSTLGDVDLRVTERGGHATELAREAAGEVEAIYVFSGDGGFNEALNGSDGRTPIGFVPGGGANVLPRALGLPRDPVEAARRLLVAKTRRISLGRVNGRRFGFSAGVGLDAELVRRVDTRGRTREHGRAGNVAFVAEGFKLLAASRFRLDPVLEVRGHGRAAFALAANCDPYTYAGRVPLHVAPLARFEGGLDIVGARTLRPTSVPRFLAYVVRGGGQERARDILYARDVDRVEIVCDRPLPLQADGEDLGDVTDVLLESERDAVSVLV